MAGYFERINVVIDVATKQAQTALVGFRESVSQANGATGKLKAGWASLKQTGPATAMAFVAVGGAVANIASRFVNAAEAASTANARILEVNESMGLFGNQTRMVSERLIELAEKTALQVGVDANQIKMVQAKLATFIDLARSADEVGGAFDRATMAAIDLAAAGFGEAENNATQLGKALQDPIKGLGALRRSGVTFTAAEQKLIRALVEGGEAAKAQGMILTAIENQVGGVAVKTANATDKMAASWGLFKERLGAELLPYVEGLAVIMAGLSGQTDGLAASVGNTTRVVDEFGNDIAWMGSKELMVAAAFRPTTQVIDEQGNALLFASEEAYRKYQADHTLQGQQVKTRGAIGQTNDYLKEHAQALTEAIDEADTFADVLANNRDSLARTAYEAKTRVKELYDTIDREVDWIDVQQGIADTAEELKKLADEFDPKKDDAQAYMLETAKIAAQGKQDIADFLKDLTAVPPEVVSKILTDYDPLDVKGTTARLQALLDRETLIINGRLNVTPTGISVPANIRDGSISNNGTYVTVNIGVSGDPIETGRTIIRLINDATAAGGLGNAGRI